MRSLRSFLAGLAVAALCLGAACHLETAAPTKDVTDRAPTFSLPDQDGNAVSLATLRERGPVVLVFYRGHW